MVQYEAEKSVNPSDEQVVSGRIHDAVRPVPTDS
jgi:hypothetical protein